MCDVIDRIENRGIDKGIGIGIAKGRKEGIGIGRKEGRAEGREEGRKEGRGEINSLMEKLLAQNHIEEAKRATVDPEYCDKLLKEYKVI